MNEGKKEKETKKPQAALLDCIYLLALLLSSLLKLLFRITKTTYGGNGGAHETDHLGKLLGRTRVHARLQVERDGVRQRAHDGRTAAIQHTEKILGRQHARGDAGPEHAVHEQAYADRHADERRRARNEARLPKQRTCLHC